MPIKSILFIGGLIFACVGALASPLIGVLGYMGVYLVDPTSQWWSAPIPFHRYSMLMACFLAIGVLMNWPKLSRSAPRFGVFDGLLVSFLAILWASTAIGMPSTPDNWLLVDKMTKLFIFVLILERVATSPRAINGAFWCLLMGGLYVGWEAFTAPASYFHEGRLTGLGSSDFAGANDFGIHLAATLPIAAALLIRYRKLWQRGLVVVTVVFMMNTIVQTRSRSAFLALAAGFITAMVYSPRRYRLPLVGVAALGLVGFLALADPAFWERMQTIESPEQESSANQRLVVWRASVPMFKAHPFGVGIGNFERSSRAYVKEGESRDTHNTYITCYTELGVQGTVLFALILAYAWRCVGRAGRLARAIKEHDLELYAFALRVSFVVYLVGGFTIKRLYAECFWWFLVFPVVLLHIVKRVQAAKAAESPLPEPVPEPSEPGTGYQEPLPARRGHGSRNPRS